MGPRRSWFTLVAMLAGLNGTAAASDPLHIRVRWANTPATISPPLFQKTDIMRHYGQSYTVEAIRSSGTKCSA